jgi:hypothetical protein
MLVHKIIYQHPLVMVQSIAVVEFKMHAPIVTVRKYSAARLIKAIIDVMEIGNRISRNLGKQEGNQFRSSSLKPFAVEMMRHHPEEAEELLAAIGNLTPEELGKALETIVAEV